MAMLSRWRNKLRLTGAFSLESPNAVPGGCITVLTTAVEPGTSCARRSLGEIALPLS